MPETPAPAAVGMAIEEVDTPALLIDLDAFERNLKRMADAERASGRTLRPTNVPSSRSGKSSKARLVSAAKKWARPKRWFMEASAMS